LTRQFVAPTKV